MTLLSDGGKPTVAVERDGVFYPWPDDESGGSPNSIFDLVQSGRIREPAPALESIRPIESRVSVLAPFPDPRRNIICIGKNYAAHAEEFASSMEGSELSGGPEAPIFFTKATTTVRGPDETITVDPEVTKELDYEVELAVIIGESARYVTPEDAQHYIAGYTIVNDLTARDLQRRHGQWFLGKSLDGFCPMGPVFVTSDEIPFPPALELSLSVDGEVRQRASTSQMLFDIPTIIATLSRVMTLQAGDIIATGTPEGVGVAFQPPRFLEDGSLVEARIEGIGVLRNKIEFAREGRS